MDLIELRGGQPERPLCLLAVARTVFGQIVEPLYEPGGPRPAEIGALGSSSSSRDWTTPMTRYTGFSAVPCVTTPGLPGSSAV